MGYQDSSEQKLIHDMNNALAISDGFLKGFEKRFKSHQLKAHEEELEKLAKALNGLQRSIMCLKELRTLIQQKIGEGSQ